MGGIFLRRPSPAPVEVINDLAGDVANLFRVLRRHYQPFVDELSWLIAGRAEFDRQLGLDPRMLTDIERAVRFLYLQRLCFGGKVAGRTFGVRRDADSRFNVPRLRAELKALRDRLATVTIEQLDYSEVIRRYDGDRALFFLDPPYDQTTGYGLDFSRDRYIEMAELLGRIRGQFIMSTNDTAFVRDTFAQFDIAEVETTWTISTGATGRGAKVTELIIRNRAR
jgi:DNA adenine methylase